MPGRFVSWIVDKIEAAVGDVATGELLRARFVIGSLVVDDGHGRFEA